MLKITNLFDLFDKLVDIINFAFGALQYKEQRHT